MDIEFVPMSTNERTIRFFGTLMPSLLLIKASPGQFVRYQVEKRRTPRSDVAAFVDANGRRVRIDAARIKDTLVFVHRWHSGEFDPFAFARAKTFLARLTRLVRRAGYQAEPIDPLSPGINLPRLAARAGLGNLSPFGLLVHPAFGPRLILTGLRTDYPLALTSRWAGGGCTDCLTCVQICPQEPLRTGKVELRRGRLPAGATPDRQSGTARLPELHSMPGGMLPELHPLPGGMPHWEIRRDTMPTPKIMAGLGRFEEYYLENAELFERLATQGQSPQVLFIGCSDSRVVPELLTGAEPGDLFVTRNVANIVPPYGTGEMGVGAVVEYAVLHLRIKHIVILGHTDCGGIKALDVPPDWSREPHLARWIEHARPAQTKVEASGVLPEENATWRRCARTCSSNWSICAPTIRCARRSEPGR